MESSLPIVHHDGYTCPWPPDHRFKMVKFLKVMQYLLEDNVISKTQIHKPEIASPELVTNVHEKKYIEDFFSGKIPPKEMRKTGFHWTKGVVSRCRLEVGG